MEKDREEYRTIAIRRVRLGLLLSEIGQANGVEVSQAEMNRLVMQAAQQYNPKDRERFIQYVQQEPMAAAQLRAPLYEDKVVDRSDEHTSELQSLMRNSYAVFCLKKNTNTTFLQPQKISNTPKTQH